MEEKVDSVLEGVNMVRFENSGICNLSKRVFWEAGGVNVGLN
jgi:hypothetical protein